MDSYFCIEDGITDLSLGKIWRFVFLNWRKHCGVLFSLQRKFPKPGRKRETKVIRNQTVLKTQSFGGLVHASGDITGL